MHKNKDLTIKDYLIRGLKYSYRKITGKKFLNPDCETNREVSNELIYNTLIDDKPCMIARFGTTELNAINNYLTVNSEMPEAKKWIEYISDNTHTPWWNVSHFNIMSIYSGIFPPGKETAEMFSQRYLNDIPHIDLLACHQYYERFMPLRNDIVKVQLEMLYPFFVTNPWTRVLKGKKVLVVHPFEDTIQLQYSKRELLFDNPDVLPEFELITYKAIQSVAGTSVPYASWFDALNKMEEDISSIDFDFALIGCGAYGMPLAAHVKKMGKKAIHVGGGLQLMFGILGKRWVEQYDEVWHYRPDVDIDINYKPLFNDSWIYPLESDTLVNSSKVEDSCYWK
jgi:hypothetical protein